MKKAIILILTIICTNLVYAQYPTNEESTTDIKIVVPKKTSKIILKNDLTMIENFNYVMNSLLDNDFFIEKMDKEYGTIQTELKDIDGINVSYLLNFRIQDNSITVSGKFIMNIDGNSSFSKIENRGMKGSPIKKSFIEMYKLASIIQSTNQEFK